AGIRSGVVIARPQRALDRAEEVDLDREPHALVEQRDPEPALRVAREADDGRAFGLADRDHAAPVREGLEPGPAARVGPPGREAHLPELLRVLLGRRVLGEALVEAAGEGPLLLVEPAALVGEA